MKIKSPLTPEPFGATADTVATGSAETQSTDSTDAATAGTAVMIGDYRIIRRLGSGGMGVVYEAEQQRPRRLVALKVVQGGRLIDEHQVRLFEREAQALARLKHPGIAAIYESGRTPDGQHFFAMELVRGETLQEYLDRTGRGKALTTAQLRERLAIFRKISDAVTYAHQRGVIHRDLKPSNIIVQREFEVSDPQNEFQTPGIKVLDFGLARITDTDLAVPTVGTEIGMIRGTLPYMSPEQVRGNSDEIDLRSDVYSLGVILYEMIAGRRPYDLQKAMLHEAARIICETSPEPLSKSWSGTRRLDHDLETIVGKALEKQVARRYQSVSALSDDILRFLTGQPISARPPSAAYQMRKMVARHRVKFGFAGLVLFLITAFAIGISIQARRIAGERDRANREAARANQEAAASAQVADFLAGLFRGSDPAELRGRPVTARELLDKGAARIKTDLTRDPKLQSQLLLVMGEVYRDLGALNRAQQFLEESLDIRRQAFGPEAPDTLRAASLLGNVYDVEGKTNLAEKMLTSTLAAERRVLGESHPNTLKTLVSLANVYDTQGRYDLSVPMMQDLFNRRRETLGSDHLDTLGSKYNLAVALYRLGRFAEAERLLVEVAGSFTRVVGSDHPNTLITKHLLASVYLQLKRPLDARPLVSEVYNTRLRVLGPEHMDTLASKLELANVEQTERHFASAESLYREILVVQERVLGADHPDTLATRASLATMISAAGRFDEADRLWRDTLARMQRALGPTHPDTANCFAGLAVIELHRGRPDAALRLIQETVRVDPAWGPRIATDPEFATLNGNAAFETLTARAAK
jgi:tetratricopeptide (TPR) repeat protein